MCLVKYVSSWWEHCTLYFISFHLNTMKTIIKMINLLIQLSGAKYMPDIEEQKTEYAIS